MQCIHVLIDGNNCHQLASIIVYLMSLTGSPEDVFHSPNSTKP